MKLLEKKCWLEIDASSCFFIENYLQHVTYHYFPFQRKWMKPYWTFSYCIIRMSGVISAADDLTNSPFLSGFHCFHCSYVSIFRAIIRGRHVVPVPDYCKLLIVNTVTRSNTTFQIKQHILTNIEHRTTCNSIKCS